MNTHATLPSHFDLDPAQNCIRWENDQSHTFNRRWEVHLLALLLEKAPQQQSLHIDDFNRWVQSQGQIKPLNRSQMQRLIVSLDLWLRQFKNPPWEICHAPRKASVGPWWITSLFPVQLQVNWPDERKDLQNSLAHARAHKREHWPAPLIFDRDTSNTFPKLATWLTQTLTIASRSTTAASLENSKLGGIDDKQRQSVNHTDPLHQAWMGHKLSAEAQCLQLLTQLQLCRNDTHQRISWRKSQSQWLLQSAQALERNVQHDPSLPAELQLQVNTNRLFLDGPLHANLVLQDTMRPPALAHDAMQHMRWHALRMSAIIQLTCHNPNEQDLELSRSIWQGALLHFESRLYWALRTMNTSEMLDALDDVLKLLQFAQTKSWVKDEVIQLWQAVKTHQTKARTTPMP